MERTPSFRDFSFRKKQKVVFSFGAVRLPYMYKCILQEMSQRLSSRRVLKSLSRKGFPMSTVNARHNSTKQPSQEDNTHFQSSTVPKSSELTRDMIGPPNKVTNLRPVKFYIPPCESNAQKEFRLERERVQKWNEEFWIKHNTAFIQEGEEFRKKKLGNDEERTLNAEEMSEFYKAFLDKNWRRHVRYNFEWYSKNLYLVLLSLRVKITNLRQKIP